MLTKRLFPKFQLIPILRLQVTHDYVHWHCSTDYCVELILVNKILCENCFYLSMKWFLRNSAEELCLEEIQNLQFLRAPFKWNLGVLYKWKFLLYINFCTFRTLLSSREIKNMRRCLGLCRMAEKNKTKQNKFKNKQKCQKSLKPKKLHTRKLPL